MITMMASLLAVAPMIVLITFVMISMTMVPMMEGSDAVLVVTVMVTIVATVVLAVMVTIGKINEISAMPSPTTMGEISKISMTGVTDMLISTNNSTITTGSRFGRAGALSPEAFCTDTNSQRLAF